MKSLDDYMAMDHEELALAAFMMQDILQIIAGGEVDKFEPPLTDAEKVNWLVNSAANNLPQ